ncbi:MAG: carbohydrate binding family 9 domain-containing protein [Candidatus Marinimicrobia bacterium]|nr:carbohydrate binding family 9 domain-containing protein [Candidatus Neomarinimicrobiota bacterium]
MSGRNIAVLLMSTGILLGGKLDRVDLERPRSVKALRIAAHQIHIDGRIDEEAWQDVIFKSNFVQRDPLEGEPATELTEFAILYDDEYLYVAIKAFDSQPAGIRSILSRRDEETPSDWVSVSFDSYGDYRTAFEFWLNPQGVKRDLRRYDDALQDLNWDAIWEGQATIAADGWTAEFQIPLRELRFSGSEVQTWGLQVNRFISRKNENLYWNYWAKKEDGYVRHYGRLTGLKDIPRQRRFYLSPYTTGQYSQASEYMTAVHPENYNLASNLGADIKLGLTNNLTLDLAVNPDFGQVEADPANLNLTAFETFYAEKRPLFVEGGNIFAFPLGFGDGGQGRNALFYPRRIGRTPHNSPDTDGFVDQPTSTTILAAAKLSGKTSSGLSIGVLNAVTAREQATIRFEDQPTGHETVEPLTNYFMTRLQQDFRQGKTTVGGILTATNRRIEDEQLNFLPTGAYAGGIDLRHLFSDDTYDVQVTIAATNVLGSREAITGRQEGSIHYFQRPDARHLSVDTLASGLAGYMHKVVLSKVRGEQWRGAVGELTYSPGFDANDLGYHRSVDRRTQFIWVQRREDQPGDLIRSWSLNFNAWSGFTFAGPEELTELGGNINGNLTLLNYWSLGGGLNTNLPVLHLTALWGGPAMRTDFARNIWLFVGSDQRKDWSFSVSGYRGGQPDARMEWYGIDPSLTWRPTDYFTLTTSAGLNVFNDSWSTWADFGPTVDMRTGEERFIMAALDQTTVSTTLRFDLTLSPTLSIQFYGSPFVTAGKFSKEKLVLENKTRAKDFDDRFHIFTPEETDYDGQPNTFDIDGDGQTDFELPEERDFNYRQFNSNLVVRWEYQTGSAIYLVWSRNMSQGLANGDFNYGRDMGQLFAADAENVFMLKASYLFNL